MMVRQLISIARGQWLNNLIPAYTEAAEIAAFGHNSRNMKIIPLKIIWKRLRMPLRNTMDC